MSRETLYEKDYDKKLNVVYIDNAGISLNQVARGTCSFICERTTYDNEYKLVLKCITEITKYNKMLLDEKKLAESLCIEKTFDDQNKIYLNVKSGNIYKLKIMLSSSDYIICVLSSTQIFGDAIAMLKKNGYEIKGIFIFGNKELKANTLINNCGFTAGMNEIKIKEECKKNDNELLENIALHNFYVKNNLKLSKAKIIRDDIRNQINEIKKEILSEDNRYDLYMMVSMYEYMKNNEEMRDREVLEIYEKIKETL